VVNLGNDTAICSGDTLTLDAMNAGDTYLWNTSATTQTEFAFADTLYAVTVTNADGCAASDTMNLTVNALPIVSLGNDTTTCNTPVTLDAGNPGASYLWCDGSTTQTITFLFTSNCMVYVTDSNGCVNTDTILVIVNPLPTVSLSTPEDSLCPAEPAVTLVASPVGGTLSGTGILGNDFTPFNAGPGTHEILYMYTDANGCSASDSLDMFVFPISNVSITASDLTVCIDDADVLLSGSPAGGFFNGPGVNGTAFEPNVAGLGTSSVMYVITDTNGCNFGAATGILVNACVGIEEQVTANAISVYPNPSNGNVTISIAENSDVTVFNMQGESVMQLHLAAGNHSLDMTGFAEGIYMIRTQNVNGIFTNRLLIQK
jgi:hypothetical protein